jgi:adenylate cyclase
MDSYSGRMILKPRLRRRLLLGLAVGAGAALVAIVLRSTTPLQVAEARSYDLRAGWVADRDAADSAIVLIVIDENSIEANREELGRWPWDREAYDPLITYAAAGGARAIVFDITFPEPHRHYPVGDTILAEALADAGNVVLAMTLHHGDDDAAAEWDRNRAATDAGHIRLEQGRALLARHAIPVVGTSGIGRDLPYGEEPYPLIGDQAAALGVINWTPDQDGVSRSQQLVFSHRGAVYPSLPLAAARVIDPDRFAGDAHVSDSELRIGDERIPLHHGRLIPRWHGPYYADGHTTYRSIPAQHIIFSTQEVWAGREPPVPLEAFADRIVIIAATAVSAFETRATPVASHDPGVMIHATILDNLLNGDAIRRAGWPASATLAALVALLTALLAMAVPSAVVGTLAAGLVLLTAGLAATFALSRGLWVDMAAPLFGGSVAYAGAMLASYLTEGRDRRRVKEMFGRYVSPEYVARLADEHESLKLGGERIPITVLFSDIRGFTSLSERLPAETVVEMLNEYLDRMADVVFRHGGTLDKFIGDAVMAFWNAPVPTPDHATRAAEAALDMMEELETLNRRWEAAGAAAALQIGIGLNTGEAIVGNIGSLTRKLDYTAIGDPVNLAARLESATKEYGVNIIISETTRAALGEGRYQVDPLDEVRVKGKEQAVKIFELSGRRSAPASARRGLVSASLVVALLTLGAGPAVSQAEPQARWTDWVYAPGSWQGARMVRQVTRDPATDAVALVATVDVYSHPPRWRAEFRKVVNPDSMAPPLVVVADGDRAVVLTALGSTALGEHEAARDPMVQAVLASIRAGRPQPAGPARIADRAADGTVSFVIERRPAARGAFANELLAMGAAGRLGRSIARFGAHAIGGERSQEVVASAGARGVARVRTVDGEIEVMPDTVAVRRMVRMAIGIIELDRFLRDGGVRSVPVVTPKPEEGP